eukprot:1894496-Amphidinium_carterae.1
MLEESAELKRWMDCVQQLMPLREQRAELWQRALEACVYRDPQAQSRLFHVSHSQFSSKGIAVTILVLACYSRIWICH